MAPSLPSLALLSILLAGSWLTVVIDAQAPVVLLEPYRLVSKEITATTSETYTCGGGVFNIIFAYWEGQLSTTCGRTVTTRIRKACQGKASCTITAAPDYFGFDACVGAPVKTLHLFYNCGFSGLP